MTKRRRGGFVMLGHVRKRVMDVVLGSVLAALALPIIALLAVGVALSLRTWPFFTQMRIGRGQRPFRIVKLRTLPRTAPRYASKYELDQRRIPTFTRFLRSTHLDELPQLLLVPLGRMSLVGPRPEMPVLHRRLEPGFARARTSTRPGCAGLWQISEASSGLIGEAPDYDLCYLRNISVRLDLWILWQTALVVVGAAPRGIALPEWVRAPGPAHIDLVAQSRPPVPTSASTEDLAAIAS